MIFPVCCSFGRATYLTALASAYAGAPTAHVLVGQATQNDIPWLRMAGALTLCLVLAIVAALVLRKRLGGMSRVEDGSGLTKLIGRLRLNGGVASSDTRRLLLVETLRLSHNIDICVLRFDGRDVLVAATAQGVVQLALRPTSPDTGAP